MSRKATGRPDRGFTLIELLVVMIVIGILAAVAIPVFLNQRAKARDTGTKSDVSRAGKELAAYYVDGSGTLYGYVSGTVLTFSTSSTSGGVTGANTVSTLALSPGTAAPTSGSVLTNLSLTGGCTLQNSWYVALYNADGAFKTYYYGPSGGLTRTAPSACA